MSERVREREREREREQDDGWMSGRASEWLMRVGSRAQEAATRPHHHRDGGFVVMASFR